MLIIIIPAVRIMVISVSASLDPEGVLTLSLEGQWVRVGLQRGVVGELRDGGGGGQIVQLSLSVSLSVCLCPTHRVGDLSGWDQVSI